MTMLRHRTIGEMAGDIAARITSLGLFQSVKVLQGAEWEGVLAYMQALTVFPAAVVCASRGAYEQRQASPQPLRTLLFGVIVVGEYSADDDAGAAALWNLEDATARAFLTSEDDPQNLLQIEGVFYLPVRSDPIPSGSGGRAARVLTLETTDPMRIRPFASVWPPVAAAAPQVTGDTTTGLSGALWGDGGVVRVGVPGVDYVAPDDARLSDPRTPVAHTHEPGAGDSADIQTFTSDGTWTKPAGARDVRVILFGGGGGGGGAVGSSAGTVRAGGGGGGGGARSDMSYMAADIPDSVAVTVGLGGVGRTGGGSGSDPTLVGDPGGATTFGSVLAAGGGLGGTSAKNAAAYVGAGGVAASSYTHSYGSGGSGGASNQLGAVAGIRSGFGGSGGGGGGTVTAANAAGNGADGGATLLSSVVVRGGGGGGGTGGAAVASTGGATPADSTSLTVNGGSGGGGGGATTDGAGRNGGAGAVPGGAGGGGGGGTPTGGGGGAGGKGLAIVITYF
jgi:hypothetical protein